MYVISKPYAHHFGTYSHIPEQQKAAAASSLSKHQDKYPLKGKWLGGLRHMAHGHGHGRCSSIVLAFDTIREV